MKRLTLAVVLSLIAVLAVPVSGAGAVMGGERIEIDAPPWVALIESDSGFLNLGGDETVCSGSLVSRDRILTAAPAPDTGTARTAINERTTARVNRFISKSSTEVHLFEP